MKLTFNKARLHTSEQFKHWTSQLPIPAGAPAFARRNAIRRLGVKSDFQAPYNVVLRSLYGLGQAKASELGGVQEFCYSTLTSERKSKKIKLTVHTNASTSASTPSNLSTIRLLPTPSHRNTIRRVSTKLDPYMTHTVALRGIEAPGYASFGGKKERFIRRVPERRSGTVMRGPSEWKSYVSVRQSPNCQRN